MRQLKLLFGFILILSVLTACQNGESETASTGKEIASTGEEAVSTGEEASDTEAKEAENGAGESTGGWKIEIVDSTQGSELNDISVVLGYTGTGTEEFSKKAEEGKEFLLVKLICEKEEGQEVIDWEKLTVIDKDGNEYKRIEDSFIADLNMKRLPGTALNFGTNEGFIAFEVEEGASGYTLTYPFEEGELEISF